ncbi:adhesion G protein-coupled receptor L4 isoform X1 [Penaeus vannamei]|uniref:adhesion G protein-coupled receptor L4 isoform X1 n=2 Tax=Penaeus vannamei TaxID=6689 RepID=UPI00387F8394
MTVMPDARQNETKTAFHPKAATTAETPDTRCSETSTCDLVAAVNDLQTAVAELNRTLNESLAEDLGNNVLEEAAKVWDQRETKQEEAFTVIEEAMTSASIAIANSLTNCTKNFTSERLHMQVSSKPLSYYSKAEARRYETPDRGTTVVLPEQLYRDRVGEDGFVRVIVVSYETHLGFNDSNPPDLREESKDEFTAWDQQISRIISVTVVGTGDWRSATGEHVRLNFSHVNASDHLPTATPRCVWWDKRSRGWNTSGCFASLSSDRFTECSCDHLTSFSLLVDVWGRREDSGWTEGPGYEASRWLGTAGCAASLLCLALSLAVIVAHKPLRSSLCWRIRGQLCLSLLMAYGLVLVAVGVAGRGAWWCRAVGVLLHYWLLCAFSWGALEAFNMYLKFVKVWRTQRALFKSYLGAGYGFPVVVVGLTLAVTQGRGYSTVGICWLASKEIMWSFIGLLMAILAMNLLVFLLVIRILVKNVRERKRFLHKTDAGIRGRIWGSATIFSTLGFAWVTGVVHVAFDAPFSAILFSFSASSQGVWIFVFGILMDAKIRREIKDLLIPPKADCGVSVRAVQSSRETDKYDVTFTPSRTEE